MKRPVKILHLPALLIAVGWVLPANVLAAPASYLVLPFENRSPSTGLAWLSTALAATTADNLEGVGGLRPAYGAAPLLGLPTALRGAPGPAVAQQVAERGARLVFAGHFDREAWRYGVGVRAYELKDGRLIEVAHSEVRSPDAAQGAAVIPRLLTTALRDVTQRLHLAEDDEAAALSRRPTRDGYAWTLFGRALLWYYGDHHGAPKADLLRAQTLLQKVCYIDPQFAEAHRMLGLIDEELGETAKAQGQYAHALDLRPDSFAALWGLAQLYRQGGARARAQELVEKALRVRPYDLEAQRALGELLYEAERLPEAQAALQRVVAERPDHVAGRRALALVYAARGMTAELAEELARVLALTPDDNDARLDLAAAYVRLGSAPQAVAVYEEILRRKPRFAQAYRLLGDLHQRQGDAQAAAAAYQRMLRLAPDDPRPYFLLARALIDAGQDARAEQVLKDAQQFHRYLGDAWGMLGALELRRNDLSRAQWYLSRAVSRPGARPLSHYNYALLLSRQNQPEKAVAELQAAIDLDPEDAELRRALALLTDNARP